MANDYTNTSEHYLSVPAITDKYSYTREVQDLRTLVNKAMASLATRDSNADSTLLFQDNNGASLTDKWVIGYDDSANAFAIHDAAAIPSAVQDAVLNGGQRRHGTHVRGRLRVRASGSWGLGIVSPSGDAVNIFFGDADDTDSARIQWSAANTRLNIGTSTAGAEFALFSGANSEALRISSTQEVSIGTTSYNAMLRVNQSSSSGATPVLYLD